MNIKYQQWKLISFVIDAYKIIYPYIDFFFVDFSVKSFQKHYNKGNQFLVRNVRGHNRAFTLLAKALSLFLYIA